MQLGIKLRVPGRDSSHTPSLGISTAQPSPLDIQQRKKVMEHNALKQYSQLPDGNYVNLRELTRPLPDSGLEQYAALSSTLLFRQEHFDNQFLANSRSQKSSMTYLLVTVDTFLNMRGMLDVAQ